jgi:hypothetical protein
MFVQHPGDMICQYSNLMKNKHFQVLLFLYFMVGLSAQVGEIKQIPAEVDFRKIGQFELTNRAIIYDPPRGTTTTFIALD